MRFIKQASQPARIQWAFLRPTKVNMKTTLNQIRACHPCTTGWENLLAYLGKTRADDEPLSIVTVLNANGLDDAHWCLRAVEGHDREIRLYAVWCARQVQHLLTDPRSLAAIDVAERFANGQATAEELAAARSAARSAAGSAARSAAGSAARSAARSATWLAAGAATWSATWLAAGAATWSAARSAAGAAQENRLRELCAELDGGCRMKQPHPNLITALIDFTALCRHLDEQSQIKLRPLYAQANALLAVEMTAAEANAADLRNANDKAGQAHRAQDRRALRVQQNDVTAEYGGWSA